MAKFTNAHCRINEDVIRGKAMLVLLVAQRLILWTQDDEWMMVERDGQLVKMYLFNLSITVIVVVNRKVLL